MSGRVILGGKRFHCAAIAAALLMGANSSVAQSNDYATGDTAKIRLSTGNNLLAVDKNDGAKIVAGWGTPTGFILAKVFSKTRCSGMQRSRGLKISDHTVVALRASSSGNFCLTQSQGGYVHLDETKQEIPLKFYILITSGERLLNRGSSFKLQSVANNKYIRLSQTPGGAQADQGAAIVDADIEHAATFIID